jgi:hypothetical protein
MILLYLLDDRSICDRRVRSQALVVEALPYGTLWCKHVRRQLSTILARSIG